MGSFIFEKTSEWSLYPLMFEMIIQLKSLSLISWFVLSTVSMILTTYFNVLFFSTITINVNLGLKYLVVLFVFEKINSYCSLQQGVAKNAFVLDFLERFQTKLNQRILSGDWLKIKLSDQIEIRRKIDDACSSTGNLLEQFIDQLKQISKFLTTLITIFSICPIATILIGIVYIVVYRYYFNVKNIHLLDTRAKMIKDHTKLYTKYSRVNANLFDYVIHHEKNQIIQIKNQIIIQLRRNWFSLDYLFEYLSFEKDILGKFCTLIVLVFHYVSNGMNLSIIPLFHYLSKFTETIHKILRSYTRWIRTKKEYDLVQPILEEYQQRIEVEQIELKNQFQIEDLSFEYQGKREGFRLHYDGLLTFKMGESILITGKSGAGNIEHLSKAKLQILIFRKINLL